mmetsp:Transcript_19122/g.51442  ORF Transcript_19122/g.51442 Transcript_19122/m.51442 type:complete len:220 (-) Transcript_19122:541-1200(-)
MCRRRRGSTHCCSSATRRTQLWSRRTRSRRKRPSRPPSAARQCTSLTTSWSGRPCNNWARRTLPSRHYTSSSRASLRTWLGTLPRCRPWAWTLTKRPQRCGTSPSWMRRTQRPTARSPSPTWPRPQGWPWRTWRSSCSAPSPSASWRHAWTSSRGLCGCSAACTGRLARASGRPSTRSWASGARVSRASSRSSAPHPWHPREGCSSAIAATRGNQALLI